MWSHPTRRKRFAATPAAFHSRSRWAATLNLRVPPSPVRVVRSCRPVRAYGDVRAHLATGDTGAAALTYLAHRELNAAWPFARHPPLRRASALGVGSPAVPGWRLPALRTYGEVRVHLAAGTLTSAPQPRPYLIRSKCGQPHLTFGFFPRRAAWPEAAGCFGHVVECAVSGGRHCRRSRLCLMITSAEASSSASIQGPYGSI